MKTVVIEKTLYQFNELNESAKERAIRNYLDNMVEPDDFSEIVVADLQESYGLYGLRPYFSLSYSQGDGLCLSGSISPKEIFDNEKFNKIAFEGIDSNDISLFKQYDILYNINFKHNGRYYYSNSVDIDVDYNNDEYYYEPVMPETGEKYDFQPVIEKIHDNIEKWYNKVCKEYENDGYSFFNEMDENSFNEMAECNDWWFDENGELEFN